MFNKISLSPKQASGVATFGGVLIGSFTLYLIHLLIDLSDSSLVPTFLAFLSSGASVTIYQKITKPSN